MSRARQARIVGVVLLVVAAVLPCVSCMNFATVPYPDPTPELLKKQAAEMAAARHQLAVTAVISGVLVLGALAAFIYARKQQRHRKAGNET